MSVPMFAVGGSYATARGGAGLPALGAGWSRPEEEFTWTDGPSAALAIPLAASGARRLRLRLDGIIAPARMVLRVSANGRTRRQVLKGEPLARDYPITLTLPAPPGPDAALSIELAFSDTFPAQDVGRGADARRLGYALRSFAVVDEASLAAGLQALVEWRAPRVTLVLEQAGEPGFLAGLLADAGVGGALITMADGAAGRTGQDRSVRAPILAGGAPVAILTEYGFAGSLPGLLRELAEAGTPVELIVLSAGELLAPVLSALDPLVAERPQALPDIAVCDGDAGLIDAAYSSNPDGFLRVVHRFAVITADPDLVSFTR